MARWVCPYCNRPQVYNEKNSSADGVVLWVHNRSHSLHTLTTAVLCLDEECERTTLHHSMYKLRSDGVPGRGEFIQSWRLWPNNMSKPQPDYIPKVLRDDYNEACLIKDLSPKAAATLARRCLQGMIRDFCGISKGTLGGEIEGLRKMLEGGSAPAGVSPESIDGIDAVRSIGSIGAHMEKDINIIVDVDPGEAQVLIELIETLFDEWYVARQMRAERFARVTAIAAEKKATIAQAKLAALPPPD